MLRFPGKQNLTTKIDKQRFLDLYSFSFWMKVYTFLKMHILPLGVFSEDLPPTGFFVDVGTGFGYMANFVLLESNRRRMLGIDIDDKRISIAKKTILGRSNIDFVCGDLKQFGHVANIDVAIMIDVLHHIPTKDHKEFLKCIYDKIKPGGIFVIRETDKKKSIKYYLMNYLSEVLLYPFSEKCNFYTAQQVRDMLEEAGFKIVKDRRSSPWFVYEHIYYLCKK